MPRTTGTYTAPSNSFNPAVPGTNIDEADWNATLDDIEAALTASTYTDGLGSADNRLLRTDGTDTKKIQGSAITVDDNGVMSGIGGLVGSVQSLSGAGAVNLTTLTTTLTTTGANALTLADGAVGQIKIIVMIADGGDGTLTPTNLANGTTLTFADVGDAVTLQFIGTEWWVISNNGAVLA
jgi:hypothetical protein